MSVSGVLVVDKPKGPTSHDVVARVRRALRTREVGHAGTLDPMATGVLVVAVGEATKLVPWLTAHDKSYRATLRLGVATHSLDAEGEIVEERPVLWDDARLEAAVQAELARSEQVPPAVSAIKVDGVAAHARVRRGEALELPARPVVVRRLTLLALRRDPPELDLEIACGKGYYVRSLARDLSERLGTVGHLTALRRLSSGPFTLDDAVALDGPLDGRLLSLCAAAERALGSVELTEEGVVRAGHGKRLFAEHFIGPCPPGPSAWVAGGRLVAVGAPADAGAPVLRGFRSPA
jgi:tRNA pseudouridine55 synthase